MARLEHPNQLVPPEIWEYYQKVSIGLTEERSYDDWGPETEEGQAHGNQPERSIKESFHPMRWESGFTGRGSKLLYFLIVMSLCNVNEGIVVDRHDGTMERPGVVGPRGEMLVMDVDPVSNNVLYRVVDGRASQSRIYTWMEKKRRNSCEAASKMYKGFKERVVNFFELSRMTISSRSPWSDERYNL